MISLSYILGMIVWSLPFIVFDIQHIFTMLGGSFELYILLPIIAALGLTRKTSSRLIWSILLTIFGLVLINYAHSYFLLNHIEFKPIKRIYVVLIPIVIILSGFLYTYYSFISVRRLKNKNRNDNRKVIANFNALFTLLFILPLFFTIPILFRSNTFFNINSLGYNVALAGFLISGFLFLFEVRKIPMSTIHYFTKPIEKIDVNFKKMKKYLLILFIILFILSIGKEFIYRKHWLIWSETIFILIIYFLMLMKLTEVLFAPKELPDNGITNIYLPSIREKRNIIKGIVLFIILILIFIVCIITDTTQSI